MEEMLQMNIEMLIFWWRESIEEIDDSDYQRSLDICGCVRIGRDLELNSLEVTHYIIIPLRGRLVDEVISNELSNELVEQEFLKRGFN
jgi:hypothetical protein